MKKAMRNAIGAVAVSAVVSIAYAECTCKEASQTSSYAACTARCTVNGSNGATNCTFTTSTDWLFQCNAQPSAYERDCVPTGRKAYGAINTYTGTCFLMPPDGENPGHRVCSPAGPPTMGPVGYYPTYETVECVGG